MAPVYMPRGSDSHSWMISIVRTFGAPVIDPVWSLLETAYAHFGTTPTLLERDFNIPPLPELMSEVRQIGALQSKWQTTSENGIASGSRS